VKRGAFALLASLALHDKTAPDAPFLKGLGQIEQGASDGRNFVKKGVSWALRGIGRRNLGLHTAAVTLARRLSDSRESAPRWVGKDALRELTSPAVMRRLGVVKAPPKGPTRPNDSRR
jgi:3-methyladenine DNA glycosylase AlkD